MKSIVGQGRQAGRSIIEILVSMAIGVIVIGSVMTTVISTSTTSRTQDNLGKLSEDAQIALGIVESHLRMSGFSIPRQNTGVGVQATNYNGAAIRACDGPITNMGDAMDVFICGAVNQPNAFSIAYEADLSNTMPGPNGIPTDCLGQELAAQASPFIGRPQFFVAENRFFIRNGANGDPELACAGNGGVGFGAPQTLVENVEDMRLTFGTSDLVPWSLGPDIVSGRVQRYLGADEIDATWPAEAVMDRWLRVASVRVCLVMRTDDDVSDQATPYTDCAGNLITPPDRRIRIAVSTTINLRNGTRYFDDPAID